MTVVFSSGFYFLVASSLVVKLTPAATGIEETLVLGVDYLVTLPASSGANGSVTLVVPPAASDDLVIERTVPIVQATTFRLQGSFSPAIHEDAFDYRTFVDQQLERRIAALEALASLTSIATFDAQVVEHQLDTDAAEINDTFPFDVAMVVGGGGSVTGVQLVKCSDPSGLAVEAVSVRSWSWVANVLTIDRITGLEPGTTYQLTLLCLTLEP